MEALDAHLKSLQGKLQLLVKQNQALAKQNALLQKEAETLRISVNEKNSLLQQLHQQIDLIKLSTATLLPAEKKLLEKRIEVYLSEIEKCIALLNV
ncbi:MAG TPA: hypothetical protein PLP23_05125 [Panacibacter sp.]|nr:hypothetical protein [Panacibacter sp.]